MGAASSVDDHTVKVALHGIKGGEVSGLDLDALRPYLEKFLRMRKVGTCVRACYQATYMQLVQNSVDPSILKPLEDYLKLQAGSGQEEKWETDEAFYEGFYKSGPDVEELLSVFGFSELDLRQSLRNTEQNSWKSNGQSKELGFNNPEEYTSFMEKYLYFSTKDEALLRAEKDGATKQQLRFLQYNFHSREKHNALDKQVEERQQPKKFEIKNIGELFAQKAQKSQSV